jgi:hypothetical protein
MNEDECKQLLIDQYAEKFGELPDDLSLIAVIGPTSERMANGERFEWSEDGNWRGLKKV